MHISATCFQNDFICTNHYMAKQMNFLECRGSLNQCIQIYFQKLIMMLTEN